VAETTFLMTLKYAGRCALCGAAVPVRTRAYYDRVAGTVICRPCGDPVTAGSAPTDPVQGIPRQRVASGTAGGSAQREYERRSARRDERIRGEHRFLGRAILALTEEPQSTRAWATGARGEQIVAHWLDQLTPDGARVLHDRRIPRTRANIDHLVVCRAGVFVIDAKYYRGRQVRLETEGGWGRPRRQKLVVAGRDQTALIEKKMQFQLQRVRAALAARDGAGVPVTGMLCFVEAQWPLGSPLVIDDVHVLGPEKIWAYVHRSYRLDQAAVEHWHRVLAASLPQA
jgi:hypothetical protein